MASSVFYKWASRKDESRISFEGTSITVFDLKREIILANNLVKGNDFDIHVYDAATKQELPDTQIVPRSSSVIVKRLPIPPRTKSKIPMYVAGASPAVPTSEVVARQTPGGTTTWHKGALSKRFDGKDESAPKPATPAITASPVKSAVVKEDEAAAMAAIFSAQTQNWEETQEKMSQATPIYNNPRGTGFGRGGGPGKPHMTQDRPLPPSYVCYRCGQKGHWIQDCPTNNDREFDNRPRIKRTTGIPRSMLKAVENPNTADIGQGIMVTPEGGYVVAQPDLASWQKQVARPKGLTVAEVREKTPTDPSLTCPIDNKLFRDAVKTPCCGTAYCEECIQTHLLERDFICPHCSKKIASLDKLIPDKESRDKVHEYIEKAIEESRNQGGSGDNKSKADGESEQSGFEAQDQDIYSEHQPDMNIEMSQAVVDSIPQLQASIAQISKMLQNPGLPPDVRQQTELQHQQLQMQLQEAQMMAAALAMAATYTQQQQAQNMPTNTVGYGTQYQQSWTSQYISQQPGPDSAYQRLPVNNRRRNLKRERPSDFLDVTGEQDSKVPRYWE
ncbi:zinc knuckle domain-containing protein [Coprinopsis cinerea okayama7|uniref:Zinc knuckle domain-containing protein n=1 Tax=Coprinopsis cinerea (strain Okayama-7 / 130 / ATCC MYA-4618 / FGSC 9003) TaxID=240176 RepID=A8N917_COPC7|nr:zinc knuckle domain-containing protein [Coprinopsis cinerea okayama7\|eukprot:XP_001831345.1 zinc knuckle domain-containing protein [Coprinopsis cinerea okayama7\